jgi:hypothetical protein
MTKAEAQAYRDRWKRVNEHEQEELRQAPPALRLRQFNTLLGWAHQLGWAQALAEGEEEVRARWMRLREAYRARP